jgi:2-octaprenyl-6-methoxyphenol hydroxylase
MANTAWRIAVVGAGPVGLALALQAARLLPHSSITLFDARPAERDMSADGRTLALALGSVQFLQQLGAWPADAAEPIREIHISQTTPTAWLPAGRPEVHLSASELGLPLLGAVLPYGALVAPLQRAWTAAVDSEPQRLRSRFGTPVAALKPLPDAVEVDAGIAEPYDLAVVAEGGVFNDQPRKPVVRDYAQTAWVGQVDIEGGRPGRAFERFTRHGPAALLPLPRATGVSAGRPRAALVWCVDSRDDPVRDIDSAQRLAVLNTVFPAAAGKLVGITPLKDFALGLNAERSLVQGRTVRIGNAAQTLHPVAGQGLNLGLRDAHELVARLRWAEDLDAVLARVNWSRAPDRWALIATTDFLARSFTWDLPGLATARGVALAALQATPLAKGWLARRMMFGAR